MIYYNKHSIDNSDINAVIRVLKSNHLTQGPINSLFEKKLSKYFGAKYCNVVSNGTVAIYLSLLALNLNKKDFILVSPLSFVAGAISSIYLERQLDFVDIDKSTYAISEIELEKKIINLKKKRKKVGCVIVTDYAGIPANWTKINKLKAKYGFKIINDNCHAIGSKYLNSNKYAVKYADVVVQSYHAIKNITTGEGGSILTNKRDIYKKITLFKTHGITRSINEKKKFGLWYYDVKTVGLNFRLSDIQCALGLSQFTKIDKFLAKRKRIANIYNKIFSNFNLIQLPKTFSDRISSYHIYPILINFDMIKITKKILFNKLEKLGYTLQVNYIPTYHFTIFKKNFKKTDFPNAEFFYKNQVSLPCFVDLSNKDAFKFGYSLKKLLIKYEK